MKRVKWAWSLCVFLWCLIVCLPLEGVLAQGASDQSAGFQLQDGDRVVFLGNSLFEEDLRYGYLEYMLATAFADKKITFRNIGWGGDTVFGDARSYYTSPPTAYDLLIQQLSETKPTVVFLAYGANEATKGKEGIAQFKEGLNQLLDKIDELGARTVLLSPLPLLPSELDINREERNQILEVYAGEIEAVATARGQRFVDIFHPFQKFDVGSGISREGVLLNQKGYYHLAQVIGDALGLTQLQEQIEVDVAGEKVNTSLSVSNVSFGKEQISFTLQELGLPLVAPVDSMESGDSRRIKIQGLKKGFYSLTVEGQPVASASAKEWAQGVEINHGPDFTRAQELRNLIFKKNELYFHRYRPLNRTYILGFRAYEQGRHTEGLDELGAIVAWLDTQINLKKAPRSYNYMLTPIQ
jgi:lysophospholipase L1-like esterase